MVALAIGARLAAQLALGTYAGQDPWEYDAIARNVIDGRGFVFEHLGTVYRAYTAPVYPLLLVAAHIFGPSSLGPGLLSLALGGALALTIYAIARVGTGDTRVALLAGGLVALHPSLLVYSSKLHALNLDAALLAALVLVLLMLIRVPARIARLAIPLGMLTGVAILQRVTFVPLIGIGALVVTVRAVDRARVIRGLALTAVIAAFLAAPWIVRNVVEIGRPTILTTGGQTLWIGNNPNATGGALTLDGRAMLDTDPALSAAVFGRSETEQDDAYRQTALSYMTADPGRTALATARKLWAFWWFGPAEGSLYPPLWLQLYQIYYVAVLVFAAFGAIALRRAPDLLTVLAVTFATISIAHAIVYVEGRHRWELEPLLLVLTAAGILTMSRRVPLRL